MPTDQALTDSQERFREAMEATSDGLWDWDIVTDQGYFSPAYYRMLGYEPDEFPMTGQRWIEFIHPEDRKRTLAVNQDCIENRCQSFEVEYRMRAKDGSWKWILGRGKAPKRDAQGRALRMIGTHVDITDRKRAEEALQASEQNYREMFNSTNEAIFLHDATTGRLLDVNDAMLRLYGYDSKEDVLRASAGDLSANKPPYTEVEANRYIRRAIEEGSQVFEWLAARKTHESFWVEVSLRSSRIGGQNRVMAVVRDIGERKRAEEERQKLQAQLNQAQKMDTVGRLAGGVAHDFNNMLTAILGNISLVLDDLPEGSQMRENLEEAHRCAMRSADLTRQLLAFARKQTVAPMVLDINETVGGLIKMLRRLIGEEIELSWLPGSDLWPVKMDPSQIDQVLTNLCVNSRDAILGMGRIIFETRNLIVDPGDAVDHPDVAPGAYVLMIVNDSGCGMDQEVMGHLFEPFFTTKGVGKGTGLGLATVYGIVKQNGGFINVYSDRGCGTTFKVYLPRFVR